VPVDKTPRGMPSTTAAGLLAQLSAIPGAHPIPVWADRADGLISCTDLRRVPALGSCAPGASVRTDVSSLFTDNLAALDKTLPLITPSTVTTTDTSVGRGLATVLVVTDSADALERARTLLSRYTAPSDDTSAAPQTFGEVAAARSALYLEIQGAVTVVAGLTLLIAGCSLAVSFSGGIVERRRPFTLLRLTGTPVRALYRVVLLETVFPLVSATVLAVAVGFAVAIPVAWALAPKDHGLPVPSAVYYLTLGSGMVLAVVVILACLPILRRITVTDSIRFE
jgi:ABC-type antimicrobial peptide transport system permease subunit